MHKWLLAGIAVLAICGAVVAGAWWFQSSSAPDCNTPVSIGNTGGPIATDPSAAADYWTPERMASAKPAEMPHPDSANPC